MHYVLILYNKFAIKKLTTKFSTIDSAADIKY